MSFTSVSHAVALAALVVPLVYMLRFYERAPLWPFAMGAAALAFRLIHRILVTVGVKFFAHHAGTITIGSTVLWGIAIVGLFYKMEPYFNRYDRRNKK